MLWFEIVLLTLVGAGIGWVTNLVAVRMLFHPRRAVRVPLTPWRIQGVLPRRQSDLARAVAETVRRDLLPPDALIELWTRSGMRDEVTHHIREHVIERLDDGGFGLVPRSVRTLAGTLLADAAAKEAGRLLDRLIPDLGDRLSTRPELQNIVQEKIEALDLGELEALVTHLAGTELRHIEILGAVLGGLIGLLQAAVVVLWR